MYNIYTAIGVNSVIFRSIHEKVSARILFFHVKSLRALIINFCVLLFLVLIKVATISLITVIRKVIPGSKLS